jgi:hypothetical protein
MDDEEAAHGRDSPRELPGTHDLSGSFEGANDGAAMLDSACPVRSMDVSA